ncbi:MAG: RNA pseudouridine synthase [Sneathiella sp.]|nr:MAG: RNA pseudouridine synthase [Sneathiella sp.]
MTDKNVTKERIAKRMARAGLCSRREAERWIEAGRVVVNGTILETPAFTVSDTDHIKVDGKDIPKLERSRLWRYHKPVGLVTSHKDEKGRETVFDQLPDNLPRVISVGRLDLNSEGLLLLTNDGELARKLELPATGWKRKYRVRVHGRPRDSDMELLARGLTIDGVKYDSIDGTIDSAKGANSWLTIGLREGKNREIRKVIEHLGYSVNRLIRISYGPLVLGDLKAGAVEEVKSRILRDQMGVEKFEDQAPEPATAKRAPRGKRGLLPPKNAASKAGPGSRPPAKGRKTLKIKPPSRRGR